MTSDDREALWAIKILDKPNMHILFELFNTTVVMWAHVKFVGKLTFECSHQFAKQAIAKSNKKSFHVQVMNSVIFTDLERLISTAIYLLRHSNYGLCLKLRRLLGRIVNRTNRNFSISTTESIVWCSILGPSTLEDKELTAQNCSLIPMHFLSKCCSYF